MAFDINQVFLIGRLTADPELKYTNSGKAVCKIRIANNPTGSDDNVNYFSVDIWNLPGENANKYLKKGSQVGITGRLRQRRWTAEDGQNRSAIDISANSVQYLSPASKGGAGAGAGGAAAAGVVGAEGASDTPPGNFDEPPELQDEPPPVQPQASGNSPAKDAKQQSGTTPTPPVDDIIPEDDEIPF